MINKLFCSAVLSLLLLSFSSHGANIQQTTPLAEILPQDTGFYLKLPGISNAGRELEGTNLGSLINNPEVQTYIKKAWQDKAFLFADLLTMLKFEEAEEINILKNNNLKYFESLGPLFDILAGDITLALFNLGEKEIICCKIDTAETVDKKKLFDLLKKVFPGAVTMEENKSPAVVVAEKLYIREFKNSIIIANEAPIISKFIIPGLQNHGLQGCLARSAEFSKMRQTVSDSADGFFIYATDGILRSRLLTAAKEFWPISGSIAAGLTRLLPSGNNFSSLALGGIKTDHKQIKHTLLINTRPSPDNKHLTAGNLAANLLQPASATAVNTEFFFSMRLPADYIYSMVTENLTRMLGKTFIENFSAAVEKIEKQAEFSIKDELKNILGKTCSIIPAPGCSKPDAFPPNCIIRLDIIDKGRLEKIMDSVRIVSSPLGWRKVSEEGTAVYYLNRFGMPLPLAPAYMIKDMDLYIAAYPQQLRALLKSKKTGKKRLAVNPAFKKALSQINPTANTAFAYFNTEDETANLYEEIICLLYSLTAMEGFMADPAVLPPAENIAAQWGATALSCNSEKDRLTIEACGPAGLLSPALWYSGQTAAQMRGRKGLINTAVLFGATIPLILRKDEMETRSLSYKRMQKIGKAYLAFNNKNGRPPFDLAELIKNNFILERYTYFPAADNKYKYAFLKPRGKFRATVPVLHEPLLKESKGVYVLFADGHIEWINRWRIEKILGILPTPADGSVPVKNIEVF
ncbi:MAG: hypothetical protein ACYTFY_07645 [Planctomycetota bacterium]|jgi:hypothetical protein